jgi:hypothetical protein
MGNDGVGLSKLAAADGDGAKFQGIKAVYLRIATQLDRLPCCC